MNFFENCFRIFLSISPLISPIISKGKKIPVFAIIILYLSPIFLKILPRKSTKVFPENPAKILPSVPASKFPVFLPGFFIWIPWRTHPHFLSGIAPKMHSGIIAESSLWSLPEVSQFIKPEIHHEVPSEISLGISPAYHVVITPAVLPNIWRIFITTLDKSYDESHEKYLKEFLEEFMKESGETLPE